MSKANRVAKSLLDKNLPPRKIFQKKDQLKNKEKIQKKPKKSE